MNTIHWLGAGLSSHPGIQRLASPAHCFVLWNRTVAKALAALEGYHGEARVFDWSELQTAVHPGDILVSMLPADQHIRVAEICLEHGCHFVSSSYVSPAMHALDKPAREKKLCLVNEVGLDPGIDHLMAQVLMEDYRRSDAMNPDYAHHFNSFCGGFPSEPNDFRYKFSWSPLGVLRALKTPARWIEEGEETATDKPWKALSSYSVQLPAGEEIFQAYPNRDSLPFTTEYGFTPEFNVQRFIRGTLRLNGWAEAWSDIFDTVESCDTPAEQNQLANLSNELWEQYAYAPDEADRVVLHVDLEVKDGGKRLWHGAYALDERGNASGSAMARLVSKTVSIAVEAVMADELPPGVSGAPSDPRTARNWLNKLIDSGEKILRT